MDKVLDCVCLQKIKKYHCYKREAWKVKTRNEIYRMMQGDMISWVSSILKKWGKYESKEEIISLSWECFLYCFNKFDFRKNVPIPHYFYQFTRYYLLNKYAKEEKVTLPLNELKEILASSDSVEDIAYEKLLTLMQFQNTIPEEYLCVWQDALQSVSSNNYQDRVYNREHGLPTNVYFALKKVFRNQVMMVMNK